VRVPEAPRSVSAATNDQSSIGRESTTARLRYAFNGPRRFDEPSSYADPDTPVRVTAEIVYAHSLGEVVNAAIAAGLRIDALHEHAATDLDPRGKEWSMAAT
jgi:hypothetical protein